MGLKLWCDVGASERDASNMLRVFVWELTFPKMGMRLITNTSSKPTVQDRLVLNKPHDYTKASWKKKHLMTVLAHSS